MLLCRVSRSLLQVQVLPTVALFPTCRPWRPGFRASDPEPPGPSAARLHAARKKKTHGTHKKGEGRGGKGFSLAVFLRFPTNGVSCYSTEQRRCSTSETKNKKHSNKSGFPIDGVILLGTKQTRYDARKKKQQDINGRKKAVGWRDGKVTYGGGSFADAVLFFPLGRFWFSAEEPKRSRRLAIYQQPQKKERVEIWRWYGTYTLLLKF